jgi:hypothetical protein
MTHERLGVAEDKVGGVGSTCNGVVAELGGRVGRTVRVAVNGIILAIYPVQDVISRIAHYGRHDFILLSETPVTAPSKRAGS